MGRILEKKSLAVLQALAEKDGQPLKWLRKSLFPQLPYKEFYNLIFRLGSMQFLEKRSQEGQLCAFLLPAGKKSLAFKIPAKDGVWKLVIFDIPEKHKKIRAIFRNKLKTLGFKKWQNSIWASPYELQPEIEAELFELGKKFFIRLIKTTDINHPKDLEQLFVK